MKLSPETRQFLYICFFLSILGMIVCFPLGLTSTIVVYGTKPNHNYAKPNSEDVWECVEQQGLNYWDCEEYLTGGDPRIQTKTIVPDEKVRKPCMIVGWISLSIFLVSTVLLLIT